VDADGQPDSLVIDGIVVPLLWNDRGPQMGNTGRPGEGALGFFVLVSVGRTDIIAALDRRDEIITPCPQESPCALHVAGIEADLAQEWQSPADRDNGRAQVIAAAQRWVQWAGKLPGTDAYKISVPWSHGGESVASVIVPRSFLRSLLTTMATLSAPTL
jgi:hypothetical protein